MGTIIVKRKDSVMQMLSRGTHSAKVYIDNKQVGALKEGDTGRYQVEDGEHKVKVGMFTKSTTVFSTKSENKYFGFGNTALTDILSFVILAGLLLASFLVKNDILEVVCLVVVIVILLLRIRYLYKLKEIKEKDKND